MRTSISIVAVGGLLVGGSAQAEIFSFPLTAPNPITPTAQFVNVDTTGASGRARAFYMTGDWELVAGNPFSNEFRVQMPGVTNVGGGALERTHGGVSNGNPFSFDPPAVATWVNNTTTGPLGHGYNTMLANESSSDLGGIFSVGFRQTFGGSAARLNNASIHFLTDIFAPVPFNTATSGLSMAARPSSLTTVVTATAPYNYDAFSFIAPASGPLHIAMRISPDTDGYLLVYRGAFDPLNPLVNLAGLDDVGGLGDPRSADLFLGVTQGEQITVVSTLFAGVINNEPVNASGIVTVAGAIPEPASLSLLALGGLALRRRR